jgi:uncharacterized DUF497 family protein
MKNLLISDTVSEKIQTKHSVNRSEVIQCFTNRSGKLLSDNREKHQTNPPTLWFIAKTNKNRALKIVYIQLDNKVLLKSAFEPNEIESEIYRKFGE